MHTKVLIVDDHELVREGMRLLVDREPDLEVVGEAVSGESAIDAAQMQEPDVILMDVRMPGIGGVEATRLLQRLRPQTHVLIVSAFPDHLGEAMAAGAAGYVLKSGGSRQLLAALRSVALGATVIGAGLSAHAVFGTTAPGGRLGPLTTREIDIVRLVANGLTNGAIAGRLGIARRTADQHVHNIFVKIGVSSRSEAVRYAIQHGILATESGAHGG